ncbi:hypothetical protein C493_05565 [Natronolimnohabitans innermongolicus JCM 12255]|uniref:Uncharacterized protein n=2 Tax=Natronolimnohabitans innermongolicus TaxID=253107 RepID=L9XEM4_9EURY|nr:hypothetical protein C493_05565 [Natronolimnohabitans innermongolicus JCM 12255]
MSSLEKQFQYGFDRLEFWSALDFVGLLIPLDKATRFELWKMMVASCDRHRTVAGSGIRALAETNRFIVHHETEEDPSSLFVRQRLEEVIEHP